MPNSELSRRVLCVLICVIALPSILRADDDDKPAASQQSATSTDTHVGLFGWLNARSAYFHDVFPEPFLVEDTVVNNELRLDWRHIEGRSGVDNQLFAEVQRSIGIVTFEVQGSYLMNHAEAESDDPQRQDGVGQIELGGRMPIHQFFQDSAGIDNTIGFNLEVGAPTNTRVSKNTEITPGIFDDLRVGGHFTVQTLFSVSSLLGSKPAEGRESLEYGIAFGYSIEDEEFAVPHVERLTPIFELVGETALSGSKPGHDALTATAGLRIELKSIGEVQPQLGVTYLFPIDQGGREEMRWGIITSLEFEF